LLLRDRPLETLSIQRFTSSDAGAWSNAYLISGRSDAILFDVFMVSCEAAELAEAITKTGKNLQAVMISHAHPDHFMGLDGILNRFPSVRVVSTANVVGDIEQDGPWMLSMLQNKLGPAGPKRLVVPEALNEPLLRLAGNNLDAVEFGECKGKHMAAVYIPTLKALLSADLVYNGAHLYVAEKHIASWLERLKEMEAFAGDRVSTIHLGHGAAGDLELIPLTRQYLNDFAKAVQSGDAKSADLEILGKYAGQRAQQFLTAFSISAFFRLHHRRDLGHIPLRVRCCLRGFKAPVEKAPLRIVAGESERGTEMLLCGLVPPGAQLELTKRGP
jgi:glyoxylase-like metal-dependent hydrolase (beta-lactamase superfamily II)